MPRRARRARQLSASKAKASSGMMMKVVSGMAITLAAAPYKPARWKWNKAIGSSASSTATPVATSPPRIRSRHARRSHRRAERTAAAPIGCCARRRSRPPPQSSSGSSAPASASGRNRRTRTAPAATSRMLSASRPKAIPPSTSTAATQLRTVGTCAPVKQGVADPRQRRRRRRDQHQIGAQREHPAQREQAQGQQHHRRHHRRDVQPADRQQMGQPAPPHRVGIGSAETAF